MIILDGREYGTAAEVAVVLSSPGRLITAATVRDWGRRAARLGDPLCGLLPRYHRPGRARGTTWYPLVAAAEVERRTRGSRRVRGAALDLVNTGAAS